MIKIVDNTFPPDLLRIEYMPGNVCNYKCSYCFPGSNEGDMLWPDIDLTLENFSHLLNYYSEHGKTKFNIYLVGGETTVWKDIERFCSELKEKFDVVFEVSTNGSRNAKWWKTNAKLFDHVGISVHNEFAKIDHVIEVADIMYEEGIFLNADVLMDPDNFEKCQENIELLKQSKHEWPILAKGVYYDGKHRYNEDQLQFLVQPVKRMPGMEWYYEHHKKFPTETVLTYEDDSRKQINGDGYIIANDLNRFRGWKCWLGVDTIKIFPDGRITGNCQQKLYGSDDYYNIYKIHFKHTFRPEIKPVICEQDICPCAKETVTKKHKL